MHFSRKTILVVGAALLAACGDKVTVSEYTPPATAAATPKVNSVSVAPATATLTVGQSITLTAAVNADAGVATTVTWSASAANVTVTTAGVVTAVSATPGVAVCATSTVDAGKKGCASIVVSAATATIPATISINAITTTGGLNNTVDPTNVNGKIDVTLNVNPGNQTVQKIVLLVAGVRQDSQTFSAAQSAALRYAADEAVAAQSTFPQVVFTVNTAAYDAATGVAKYANGNKAISAQLYVAGTTTAAATATAASNLTFNNNDAVYGTWTLPTTNVKAADALGYQWVSLGGGNLTLNVTPVIYSGKTASSVTIKYVNFNGTTKTSCAQRITAGTTGYCYNAAFGDTASVKTLTTFPATATFTLFDRDMIRGGGDANVIAPPVPTFNMIFSDGTSLSDANVTAPAGTSLALRIDNVAPANVTVSAPMRGSLAVLRAAAAWAARPGSPLTDADSSSLITAVGADNGVSNGATLTVPRGITWKVFTSAGSTTTTDTASVGTTAITSAASLTEGSVYCVQVKTLDALGNGTIFPDAQIATAGTIGTTTCAPATNQTRGVKVDNTAPVTAFAGAGIDFSAGDTAGVANVAAGLRNYFFTVTDNNKGTDSISVCNYTNVGNVMTPAGYIGGSTTACPSFANTSGDGLARAKGASTLTNRSFTTTTKNANLNVLAVSGQIVYTSQHYDLAGNVGNRVTRVVIEDLAVPTASAATVASVTMGTAPTVSSFLNDNMSIAQYALEVAQNAAAVTTTALATATNGNVGAPILRYAWTSSGEGISTAPLTKFLNVPVSVSGDAITYLLPWTATNGSNAAANDLYATNQLGYRLSVIDQAGQISAAAGAFTYPTVMDAWGPSFFNEGFVTSTASTSAIVGATAGITLLADASTNAAFAGSTSAVAGAKALTNTMKLTIQRYTKYGYLQAAANSALSSTGATYCVNRGTDSQLAKGALLAGPPISHSTVGEASYSATSTPTPVVQVFLPVAGNGAANSYFQYYGTATLLTSSLNPGAVGKSCNDVVTETYSIAVTPGVQAFPNPNWTGGDLLWVVKQGKGVAAYLKKTITYDK